MTTQEKSSTRMFSTIEKGKDFIQKTKRQCNKAILTAMTALTLVGTMNSCESTPVHYDQDGNEISQIDREARQNLAKKPKTMTDEAKETIDIQKDIKRLGADSKTRLGQFTPGEKIETVIDGKKVTVAVEKGRVSYGDICPMRCSEDVEELQVTIEDAGITTDATIACRKATNERVKKSNYIKFTMEIDGVTICNEVADCNENQNFRDHKAYEHMQYIQSIAQKAVRQGRCTLETEYRKHKKELEQIKYKADSLSNAKKAKEKAAREYADRVVKVKK